MGHSANRRRPDSNKCPAGRARVCPLERAYSPSWEVRHRERIALHKQHLCGGGDEYDIPIVAALGVVIALVVYLLPSSTTQWTVEPPPHTLVGSIDQFTCSQRAECLIGSINDQVFVSRSWVAPWEAVDLGTRASGFTISARCTNVRCTVANGRLVEAPKVMTFAELRRGGTSVSISQITHAPHGLTFQAGLVPSMWCTATGSFCMLLTLGGDQRPLGGTDQSNTTTTWTSTGPNGHFIAVSEVSRALAQGGPPVHPACASQLDCLAIADDAGGPWATTTGGSKWRRVPWASTMGDATAVDCGANSTCAVGTSDGTVYFTHGSGTDLRRSPIPGPCHSCGVGPVSSLSCWSAMGCVAVTGPHGVLGSLISKTTNQGRSWEAMSLPDDLVLDVVSCASGRRCLAEGYAESDVPRDHPILLRLGN